MDRLREILDRVAMRWLLRDLRRATTPAEIIDGLVRR